MRLKTACSCMSLSTGSIILGSLCIITSITLMILLSIAMNQSDLQQISDDNLMLIKSLYTVLMIYFPVEGISAALMIFGCIRRNSDYVFPWLALAYSGLVGTGCGYVASIIRAVSIVPIAGFFGLILIIMAAGALQLYLWLIVYSLYKDLLDEKYGRQVNPKTQGLIYSKPDYNI